MKRFIAIVIIGIFSIVTAAAVFSDHSGGHHGQTSDCIFSAMSTVPCPKQATPATNLLFHLNAIKQFFLAATEIVPLVIGIFFVAVAIFRSVVFRRFWRSIYDTHIHILRLQTIAIKQPCRVDFPLRE